MSCRVVSAESFVLRDRQLVWSERDCTVHETSPILLRPEFLFDITRRIGHLGARRILPAAENTNPNVSIAPANSSGRRFSPPLLKESRKSFAVQNSLQEPTVHERRRIRFRLELCGVCIFIGQREVLLVSRN